MLIFHNPHARISFGQTLMDFLLRNNMPKKANKYQYLLDFLSKNDIKIGLYIDYKDSSLPLQFQKKIFIKIEVYLWLLLKGFKFRNINLIDNLEKIKNDDIFFSFALKNLDTNYKGIDDIFDKHFIKIFHFTHYIQNTSLIIKNFNKLKIDFIVAENNLSNVDYFKNFFNQYYNKNVYTLPFSVNLKKYKNFYEFKQRKNFCLSSGAIINIKNYPGLFDDFYNFFNTDTLQPLRKTIYENINNYNNFIHTINTDFKPNNKKEVNTFQKVFGKFKRLLFGSKLEYFNFDIVEKYNQYKMFICGEELGDLPGIGFVEGMACGCAYIGKVDSMYTDLGLVAGIHYIGHNGSLDDIIDKIKYYQEHNEELETIANNGYNFVLNHFNGEAVAKTFFDDLRTLSEEYRKNGYNKNNLDFNCSFIIGKK